MKKNILFFVAAAGMLTLASCSQDTTEMADNGNVIKFRPFINAMTRGDVIQDYNFKLFKVSAFIEGHLSNYFTNWQVDKNGSTWTSPHNQYWPPTGTLHFFAYYPTNIDNLSITPNEQTIKNFKVAEYERSQQDLIVACNSGTKATNEKTGITLNFKHALTLVDIYARNTNTTDYQIEVIGAKLAGFKSKADFTFPKSNASGTIPLENWKNIREEGSFYTTSYYNSAKTLTSSSTSLVNSWLFMMPQQLTAWNKTTSKSGAYIGVLLRIIKNNPTNKLQIFPKTPGKFAYVAVPISEKLLPGKFYRYTLTFSPGHFGNIAPDQTNPYENNSIIDPNPGPGGEVIMGGPIKVTVSVDNWGADTNINKNL